MRDKGIFINRVVDDSDVSLTEWGEAFEKYGEDRIIGSNEMENGELSIRISTVFIGLDHSFGSGSPLWFETMIFGFPEDHYDHEYTARYETWKEARSGHRAQVRRMLQRGFRPVDDASSRR